LRNSICDVEKENSGGNDRIEGCRGGKVKKAIQTAKEKGGNGCVNREVKAGVDLREEFGKGRSVLQAVKSESVLWCAMCSDHHERERGTYITGKCPSDSTRSNPLGGQRDCKFSLASAFVILGMMNGVKLRA